MIIDLSGTTTVVVEDQDSDGASPFVAFDSGVWLTDYGWVAFVAEKPSGARAVFLSDGEATVEIASEEDAEVSEIEFFHAVANDAGVVAFRGKDAAGLQAIFAGNGADLVRVIGEHDLVETDLGTGRIDQHDGSVVFGGAPSINANGDIAFSAGLTPENDNQIEWGSGIFIAVADNMIFADGFVRLSCNPAFSADFKTPREATALLRVMLDHPDHRFIKDSLSTADETFISVVGNLQGHKQITDASLVALAQIQGLTLLTFDRKIEAFCPFPDVVEVLQLDV